MEYHAPEEALEEEEMRLLLLQFTKLMEGFFLDGGDGDWVDYGAIDENGALDDVAQLTADAEDRYFDAEEPDDPPAPPPPDQTASDGMVYDASNNWGF